MNPLKHVAIIMDGNGRWGKKKRKSRNFGHINGIKYFYLQNLKVTIMIIKIKNLKKFQILKIIEKIKIIKD